jgi:probable rRNA maturation factor
LPDAQVRSEAKKHSVPVKFLKSKVCEMLKALGQGHASVSILLVDDARIRIYNRKYLRHDRATDVMAFPQVAKPAMKARGFFLGDILISAETAACQSKHYGTGFRHELCLYACHGILHLLGWSDKTVKAALRMRRKQDQILKKVGLLKT